MSADQVTESGREVVHVRTGRRGVTTSDVDRNGRIGVMFIGGNYPVSEYPVDLTRVAATEEPT